MLCETRGGLGRITLPISSASASHQPNPNSSQLGQGSPGEEILGESFAIALAEKSREWLVLRGGDEGVGKEGCWEEGGCK